MSGESEDHEVLDMVPVVYTCLLCNKETLTMHTGGCVQIYKQFITRNLQHSASLF